MYHDTRWKVGLAFTDVRAWGLSASQGQLCLGLQCPRIWVACRMNGVRCWRLEEVLGSNIDADGERMIDTGTGQPNESCSARCQNCWSHMMPVHTTAAGRMRLAICSSRCHNLQSCCLLEWAWRDPSIKAYAVILMARHWLSSAHFEDFSIFQSLWDIIITPLWLFRL